MKFYRYSDGKLPNSVLFIYLTLGTGFALTGLQHNAIIYVLSVLLLAHCMIISAYLIHECIHNTIFSNNKWHTTLASTLAWLLGFGYLPYTILKDKHLRHHVENTDVQLLNYRDYLEQYPLLKNLVVSLEFIHFPAVEVLTHALAILSPFIVESRKKYRQRVILVFISRCFFMAFLVSIGWQVLIGWWVAIFLCMTLLGFMDAFQHSYDIHFTLDKPKQKATTTNRSYEDSNTYSNLLSRHFDWLNLLVLNFCYHNAHHLKSGEPWHRLPALHKKHYGENSDQLVPLTVQIKNFHTNRILRVQRLQEHANSKDIGAVGVSFLAGI